MNGDGTPDLIGGHGRLHDFSDVPRQPDVGKRRLGLRLDAMQPFLVLIEARRRVKRFHDRRGPFAVERSWINALDFIVGLHQFASCAMHAQK